MLILDKPYVSEFLLNTARDRKIPVLKRTDHNPLLDQNRSKELNLRSEEEFLGVAGAQASLKLYCNSENSINWIIKHLANTKIPQFIEFCKNKAKFREWIRPLYPDFYFREIDGRDIGRLDVTCIKKPFIIKPSVGFFSIGVYKVTSDAEWGGVVEALTQEMKLAEGLYPGEVMNSSKFILEECIDGDEFAIDAYYNASGKPVILNILKHPFSSDTDVSDRMYYTSKEIILDYLAPFQRVLEQIGDIAGFTNFPVHVEVRMDRDGNVTPIEFNPMRFAGWCVTDLAHFAYGINPYVYYFEDQEPDWSAILEGKDGRVYSLVLIDVPKGQEAATIKSFDYDAVSRIFGKVLEFRAIDFHEYPVFAFAFIETPADSHELEAVLKMDFSKFVSTF